MLAGAAPAAPATSAPISAAASSSPSCCPAVSDCQVGKASAWPIAARTPPARVAPGAVARDEDGCRRDEVLAVGAQEARDHGHHGLVAQDLLEHARRLAVVGVELAERERQSCLRLGDLRQGSSAGGGWAAIQCDEHAANSASSSGKWRYTVERRTPARSATALIDVRAGPSSSCSAAALSVMRRRVRSCASARCCIRYGRGFSADISVR